MQEQLIQSLREFGGTKMARDFMASGNPDLKAAAESWAVYNNLVLPKEPSPSGTVRWGEWSNK
jgi:hypothetical protein